jgi:hypothetical protein
LPILAVSRSPSLRDEVVAHVALNVFTNYFNNLAETDVDFPAAAPLAAEKSQAAECSTACGCSV